MPFGRFCGAFGDVLDDEPSEREAEDGSDVNEASVDEGFDGFVLVGIFLTAVLQEFVAEDAEEFSGGEVFFFFESTTQRSGKRTALHLPELGDGGSSFSAAPMEEKRRAVDRVALRIKSALSANESMASTT